MTQKRPPPPPQPLPYASFPEFRKTKSFLKPVLNIFILGNLIARWVRGLLKKGLVFCIKSLDLRGVLIVGGEGFIKVRVGIIYDPFKQPI